MDVIEPRLFAGTRDLLPEQMIRREYVIQTIKTIFEKYGYEPMETPSIEFYDLLTAKSGDEEKGLFYRLAYRDGRTLALRYELTVSAARVVAMNPHLVRPVFKRYQIQPVWRADRPQKGRFREFYQCDVDAIGSPSMLADAEIIAIIDEVLTALGFPQFRIEVNNRKILNGLAEWAGVEEAQFAAVCRSIDKLEKAGAGIVKAELREKGFSEEAVARIFSLLDLPGGGEEVLDAAERVLGASARACEGVGELRQVVAALKASGVPEGHYRFNLSLARGLDYYTGPIFEAKVERPRIGSLAGGGRYDGLIGLFSGRDIPAVGVALGLERIIAVMEELDMLPPVRTKTQVLVALFGPQMQGYGLELASELRRVGVNVEIYLGADKLREQFAYANRRGIPLVAIAAPDEERMGQVAVKDMRSGVQKVVERARFVSYVRETL